MTCPIGGYYESNSRAILLDNRSTRKKQQPSWGVAPVYTVLPSQQKDVGGLEQQPRELCHPIDNLASLQPLPFGLVQRSLNMTLLIRLWYASRIDMYMCMC